MAERRRMPDDAGRLRCKRPRRIASRPNPEFTPRVSRGFLYPFF